MIRSPNCSLIVFIKLDCKNQMECDYICYSDMRQLPWFCNAFTSFQTLEKGLKRITTFAFHSIQNSTKSVNTEHWYSHPLPLPLLVTIKLRATRKLQFEYVLIGLFERGIHALKWGETKSETRWRQIVATISRNQYSSHVGCSRLAFSKQAFFSLPFLCWN